MMDLRYHLASLMSIFLALAVGIVVGISLGSSERQEATIRLLQQDVAAIRSEDSRLKEVNAELQRRLARREEAEQQELLPLAVRGRLAGNRVAVLFIGDAAEDLRAPLIRVLHLAGADIMTLRLPRSEPAPKDTAGSKAEGAADATGGRGIRGSNPHAAPASSGSAPNTSGTAETNGSMLARALLAGRPALLDGVRARLPDLEVNGEIRAPVRRLLLLCPNDQPEYARRVAAGNGVEAAFGRAAQEGGAILVAAEPEAAPGPGHPATPAVGAAREATSLLPALSAMGASTVDHVDTAMGQIAAVLALAGARGDFGTGPGATRLLPAVASEGSAQ